MKLHGDEAGEIKGCKRHPQPAQSFTSKGSCFERLHLEIERLHLEIQSATSEEYQSTKKRMNKLLALVFSFSNL